jgi:hypothetical protein
MSKRNREATTGSYNGIPASLPDSARRNSRHRGGGGSRYCRDVRAAATAGAKPPYKAQQGTPRKHSGTLPHSLVLSFSGFMICVQTLSYYQNDLHTFT